LWGRAGPGPRGRIRTYDGPGPERDAGGPVHGVGCGPRGARRSPSGGRPPVGPHEPGGLQRRAELQRWIGCNVPLRRTSVQHSGGAAKPVADCTGTRELDFDARAATGKDPGLVSGQIVWAQYGSRDPEAASSTNLADALVFVFVDQA